MESILAELNSKRVVMFMLTDDGKHVIVEEQCDQCFNVSLTKPELLYLIKELQNLANLMEE